MLDEQVRRALAQDRIIDITTTGRGTGAPRRTEIWFHNLDGRLYITGTPGRRSWYANLLAHPAFTFHLKETLQADLPAVATPIRDQARRREILSGILGTLDGSRDLEAWVRSSPLVEVTLET
jgi:deazaflavin-dependent oxidoreductase (nitroreductase family)